jgi:HAD superfamily hydrolase (TIGR01549 family)
MDPPPYRLPNAGAIRAVVLDVYGTIAWIGDKHAPYEQLLRLGSERGRAILAEDGFTLMSRPLCMETAAALLRIPATPAEILELEDELRQELASIRLYPDAIPVIKALRAGGIKVALCSNLTSEYAPPILALLPMRLDAYAWSFEVGAIKPQRRIYEYVCGALQCSPEQVLMVGDTPDADVDGPRACGMQSMLLAREQPGGGGRSLSTLAELLRLPGLAGV